MSSVDELNAPIKARSPAGRVAIHGGGGPGGGGGASTPGASWIATNAGII
jgi:hypothetical protein